MQLNIRSLPSKFDKLKILIQRLREKSIVLDCILLCETFTAEINSKLFIIPGYKFISRKRKLYKGGAVGIFIRKSIKYKLG